MAKKDKAEPLVNAKRENYTKSKTASGTASMNNGDQVASALRS
jgi:hypothetical protein